MVNKLSGKPIPEDEPTFIVRAQDSIAPEVPVFYRSRCKVYGVGDSILDTVDEAENAIKIWRSQNASKVKNPD